MLEGERETAYTSASKTFQCDRYGGDGIGDNGGGARCGIAHDVQVKGLGANSLVGKKTNFWHSYGGATIKEGIREAVWGEVCHLALPHGGTRVHGLINTGTTVPIRYPLPGGATEIPRALIIREVALRPAHFMRACEFKFLSEQDRKIYVTDTERTRFAVGALSTIFGELAGHLQGEPEARLISRGVTEMFSRFADQLAAAFAKRLMHGSFTASNICLDGRWIDFGSISAVSDYGRIILARGMPDAWEQTLHFRHLAHELLFYIHKFASPKVDRRLLISGEELEQHFSQHFEIRKRTELLMLLGLSADDVVLIPERLQRRTVKVMEKIISEGNLEPFKLLDPCPSYFPVMPETMGELNLCRILKMAAFSRCRADCEGILETEIARADIRNEFSLLFWEVRCAVFGPCGADGSLAEGLFSSIIRSVIANTTFNELYAPVLNKSIDELIARGGEIPAFIAEVMLRVSALLGQGTDGLDLTYWAGEKMFIKKAVEMGHHKVAERRCEVVDLLAGTLLSINQAEWLKKYAC